MISNIWSYSYIYLSIYIEIYTYHIVCKRIHMRSACIYIYYRCRCMGTHAAYNVCKCSICMHILYIYICVIYNMYRYDWTHTYIYTYWSHAYIYIWYPPETDVFEVATLLGQITLFSLSSSGGYHIYIYTYIHTYIHMCVLIVVLLLNPGT